VYFIPKSVECAHRKYEKVLQTENKTALQNTRIHSILLWTSEMLLKFIIGNFFHVEGVFFHVAGHSSVNQWCTGSEYWTPILPDIRNFFAFGIDIVFVSPGSGLSKCHKLFPLKNDM